MIKILLNLLLNLLVGNLKAILLKHIEDVSAETITNEQKRNAVFTAIKADAIVAGKDIGDRVLNLAVELGVNLFKEKFKGK